MDGTYVHGFHTRGPIPNGIYPGYHHMIIVARVLYYQAITPCNIPLNRVTLSSICIAIADDTVI